jgi:hypothetical protein
MDLISDRDLAFVELLVQEGRAIPAIIVAALLERLRAVSAEGWPVEEMSGSVPFVLTRAQDGLGRH